MFIGRLFGLGKFTTLVSLFSAFITAAPFKSLRLGECGQQPFFYKSGYILFLFAIYILARDENNIAPYREAAFVQPISGANYALSAVSGNSVAYLFRYAYANAALRRAVLGEISSHHGAGAVIACFKASVESLIIL